MIPPTRKIFDHPDLELRYPGRVSQIGPTTMPVPRSAQSHIPTVTAAAPARAGLLGNPGDGYGGKAIAVAVADFQARVVLELADRFELVAGPSDHLQLPSAALAVHEFLALGCEDGLRRARADGPEGTAPPRCLSATRSDHATFRALMDRSFDLRAQIFPIAESDRQTIEIARSHGASAKFCGSGGAIVGAPASEGDFGRIATAFGDAGFRFIQPRVAPPAATDARSTHS